jgi:hypothetical protein
MSGPWRVLLELEPGGAGALHAAPSEALGAQLLAGDREEAARTARPARREGSRLAARLGIAAHVRVRVRSAARLRRCAFALVLAWARCPRVAGLGWEGRS